MVDVSSILAQMTSLSAQRITCDPRVSEICVILLEEPNVAAVLAPPVERNNRECRRTALSLGLQKCGKGTKRISRIIGRIRYPSACGVSDEYLAGNATLG